MILVDADLLLDIALDRRPHAEASAVIATRNVRHFVRAPIPAKTPAQLLAEG